MIEQLTALQQFADFGGVFIITLILLYGMVKKIDKLIDMQGKQLALLAILVQANTKFGGIEHLLNSDGQDVVSRIVDAETKQTEGPPTVSLPSSITK